MKSKRPKVKPHAKQLPPGAPSLQDSKDVISSGRKLLFRFLALLLVPVLLLSLLEVGLRIVGFGHPTAFFETVRVGSKDFLIHNESFSLSFFPPQLARWPGPFMLEEKKPANTCRIFVLGESAARGEPQPAYSAARYMQALLQPRFPGENFEVINLSITAINSHVILPIARDCASCQGDIWLVYMGNNEMVGPFGAATVFGRQAPPRWFARCSLALQQTRLGQALLTLARKLKGAPAYASWQGMSMFIGNQLPPNDPRKETVYRNFAKNLEDIIRTGSHSGAKVVLSTVAVNLAECPPFASMGSSNLPPAQTARRDQLAAEGAQAQTRADFATAVVKFEEALKIDPRVAELEFQLGRSFLALSNFPAGRAHLRLACDLDALPFRADSRINTIICQIGKRLAGPDVVLLDAATTLETNCLAGVCGQETFYEHVHFNFDGSYRLGRAWAEQVARLLPGSKEIAAKGGQQWASQEACEQRLGVTPWNRVAILHSVIDRLQRPPLSNQSNNARRLAAFKQLESELESQMPLWSQAPELYQQALEGATNDHWLHENFAEFLEAKGDLNFAVAQWRQVCQLLPFHPFAFFQVGRLLSRLKQWNEAEAALRRTLTLRPTFAEAWFEIGNVHRALGRFATAVADFGQARQLAPLDPSYLAYLGKALSESGRRYEAIQCYRQALEIKPDLGEGHMALADELAATNQLAEAAHEYEAVIRLQPTNVLAHLDLGVMLARQGLFENALHEFEETLRLDPGNKTARDYLDRVQDWNRHRAR